MLFLNFQKCFQTNFNLNCLFKTRQHCFVVFIFFFSFVHFILLLLTNIGRNIFMKFSIGGGCDSRLSGDLRLSTAAYWPAVASLYRMAVVACCLAYAFRLPTTGQRYWERVF